MCTSAKMHPIMYSAIIVLLLAALVHTDFDPVVSLGAVSYYTAVAYGKSIGSGYASAEKYQSWSRQQKIENLINTTCFKNALTGAGSGVFGWVGLPAGLAASTYLQVFLVCTAAARTPTTSASVHTFGVFYRSPWLRLWQQFMAKTSTMRRRSP